MNIVDFSQLSSDLASGQLPAYSFIVPDAEHDAHDCPAEDRAATSEPGSLPPTRGCREPPAIVVEPAVPAERNIGRDYRRIA